MVRKYPREDKLCQGQSEKNRRKEIYSVFPSSVQKPTNEETPTELYEAVTWNHHIDQLEWNNFQPLDFVPKHESSR